MKNKIINRIWLISLLFFLLVGFSFGCGKEIGVERNQPPVIESFVVSILSPQDGNCYDPNAIIGFAGEAEDFEEGPLTGASLVLKKEGV